MNTKELIQHILNFAGKQKFPDIHINSGQPLRMRNSVGDLEPITQIDGIVMSSFSSEMVEKIIISIVGNQGYETFLEIKELDTSYSYLG